MSKSFDFIFVPRCLSCQEYAGEFGILCRDCSSIEHCISPHSIKKKFSQVDRVFYLWDYNSPVRSAFLSFKFRGLLPAARLFARVMKEYVSFYNINLDNFFITYVPMHPLRRAFRGYNQSRVLAEEFASLLGKKAYSFLSATKLRFPQHWFADKKIRRKNVKNLFNASLPEGKMSVLIIDDVITTGYTIKECAKALKRKGAERVWAFGLLG